MLVSFLTPPFLCFLSGSYPNSSITLNIFFLVSSLTPGFPFNANETPVIGNWELLDRINSLNAHLETVPLEALKFLVLDGAKGDKSKIEIAFKALAGDQLEFYVSGISEEMGIIHVPLKLYENMVADYKKRKKNEIFTAVVSDAYISYKNIITE